MEQIRTRLAAATSAATALAKSLEALDENTLQTLEKWLAKQEGGSRCGHCRAQMPRGKEASMCISCGSKRPPPPNNLEYDFKVSFAFLQFLETIHPPLKSGNRRSWNPTVSIASKSPEPSASIEVLPVEREVASIEESIPHLKDLTKDEIPSSNSQKSLSDANNGMLAAEDHVENDDYGDFQESPEEKSVDPYLGKTDDVAKINDLSHLDENPADLGSAEDTKKSEEACVIPANSEAVNDWDTEWDFSPSYLTSATTPQENSTLPNNDVEDLKEVIPAASPQVPEYDLSFFESFGDNESKEQSSIPNNDIDSSFWDFQAPSLANPRLASLKAMERFASDISAFTTITDSDSDSGDTTVEALPPPKPPVDILMETGFGSGGDDLLGSLNSHEQDGFHKVGGSSHPLAPSPATQDPFPWPLVTLDTLSSHMNGDDTPNAEKSSAGMMEAEGQVGRDPFPWSLEEFDTGTSNTVHGIKQQESLDLMDPVRPQLEESNVDPFSQTLDSFNLTVPGVNEGNENGLETALEAQVYGTTEEEPEDWGDEEFVWSQAEPASQAQLPSNDDFPAHPSGSSPFETSFSSETTTKDVFLDKDTFLLDQSSPKPSVTDLSAGSAENFADLSNGLGSLVYSEAQKKVVGEDLSKSTHARSLSFGDSDQRPSGLDHIEDYFRRTVSFGNLQAKDEADGDELLRALQTSSISQPVSPSPEPGQDILKFLNLKPASFQINAPLRSGSSTKPSHVRSVSFGTVELVPDEQDDEMFQFFHTRSHSVGSSAAKGPAVELSDTSSSDKGVLGGFPSVPNTCEAENPTVSDDPFSFINSAIAPSIQAETVEVKAATNDDDDDFFEWKSAETPSTTPFEINVQAVSQSAVSTPASIHQDIFQWPSPMPTSPSPSKLGGSSSMSGLLSLAGGLPPSQNRTSVKKDDLFAALSRSSSTAGAIQARTSTMLADATPASKLHNPTSGDDSEDEFSDFVSTEALPSTPPTSTQQNSAHASQPPFDVSFFEAPPNPNDKRNSDFFGDLMGLNFTNA